MIGFPFDSIVTYDEYGNPLFDRAVSSKPLKNLIAKLFTTGVMPNPSNNLQVFAGADGMTVTVRAGFCVIEGGLKLEDMNRTLEIQAADSVYDRIDTVVMRWNGNDNARICDLYVIEGTPAPTPVRPELNRTGSIYEIGLADIFIPKNTGAISQQRITDTRMESARCGIVSSVSEWDTTTIYAQIQADLADFKDVEEADFLEWYESIKDRIDDITAELLQRQIDDLESNKVDKEEGKGLSTNDYDNIAKGIVDGVSTALAGKVDKVAGKGLSTNDYTNTDKNKVASIKPDATTINGNPLSVTTNSAQVAQNTVITFEPIQSGSGDSSPNNVRAISGYNDITLCTTEFNLWDGVWESGGIDGTTGENNDSSSSIANYWRTKNYIPIVANTEYYVKSPSIGYVTARFYDANKKYISRFDISGGLPVLNDVWTSPLTACYLRIEQPVSKSKEICVNISDPLKNGTYEAPNIAIDISEPFPSTVYGGTLDVESGELTVYKGLKTYNGSEAWEQSANPNACRISIPSDMDIDDPNAICDTYTYTTTPTEVNYGFAIGNYIAVKDITNCSTVADFKTYLSGHNITFAYKLANPITYHLTPHQVRLLEGANVVTSNGTSINLTYRNGKVAMLEDLDGLAESVNGLSIKVNDVLSYKSVEYAGPDSAFLVAFVKTLTPEQVTTARVRLYNGVWLYPHITTDSGVLFLSIPYVSFVSGELHLQNCYEISQTGSWFKDINLSNMQATTQSSVNWKMTLYYAE